MFERLRSVLIGKHLRIPGDDLSAKDDWTAGDLAECINPEGRWYNWGTGKETPGPADKAVLKVAKVIYVGPHITLVFSRLPGGKYLSKHFRKIIPKADAAERSDSSFIELVRHHSNPADKQPPILKPERHREDA